MSLKVETIELRTIIGSRRLMEAQGGAIVTLLLKGLAEIEQQRICLRSITPSNILLSDDLERLIFKDIHNIV